MAKIHELLAVDKNLKGQATKNRLDLQNTFEKKRTHFSEKLITFTPIEEGASPETTEQLAIQTTVAQEIAWISGFLAKAIDSSYAIDLANVEAKGDIVLEDGSTLISGVPATALLQLEKRMKEVHDLVKVIPTLDPSKGFKTAPDREKGIFAARDVFKDRTQKKDVYITITPATDKFPAQVAKETNDIKVGTIREQEWSSLITPATKADLLTRTEELIRAIEKARSRANNTEIDAKANKIGGELLDYIFQPLV